jgi:multicomponent K+:H+ antiporter subunit E
VFLQDVLLANLRRRAAGPRGPRALRPAFVVVPLDLRDELAISLLANIICLTPGTVSARLSADRRELLVHALDCADTEALVASIKRVSRRP